MTVEAAISLLLALIQNASEISALIQEAQAKGSTTLSDDVWQKIVASANASHDALKAAIVGAPAPTPAPAPGEVTDLTKA